jgi:hypothetical protein
MKVYAIVQFTRFTAEGSDDSPIDEPLTISRIAMGGRFR